VQLVLPISKGFISAPKIQEPRQEAEGVVPDVGESVSLHEHLVNEAVDARRRLAFGPEEFRI
jgi:hypothetical protein